MASLYEIRTEIEAWAPEIDETTGEITNALLFDELQMSFEEKVENIACYIKNLQMLADGIKAEETALADRRKATEKKIAYLKNLLTDNMDTSTKFATARCAVSFRSSEAVEITDEALIPKKLMVKKISFAPDKKAIKELLKTGKKIKGAYLKSNVNPQIK